MLDESDRSLHDALCVVRCLVKKPSLLVGGGAPESEVFSQFQEWVQSLSGADRYIARAYAEALERWEVRTLTRLLKARRRRLERMIKKISNQ